AHWRVHDQHEASSGRQHLGRWGNLHRQWVSGAVRTELSVRGDAGGEVAHRGSRVAGRRTRSYRGSRGRAGIRRQVTATRRRGGGSPGYRKVAVAEAVRGN